MSTTINTLFSPQRLARAVMGGFANLPVLYGSSALRMDDTMPYGADYAGKKVQIPYWNNIQRWQTVVAADDGNAITPLTISSGNAAGSSTDPEEEVVEQIGVAINPTAWARRNPDDPMGEGRRQMRAGLGLTVEQKALNKALSLTGWAMWTHDKYNASTPYFWERQTAIKAKSIIGQSAYGTDGYKMLVVHSHIAEDLQMVVDAIGRPLLVTSEPGPLNPTGFRLADGTPVMVTDEGTQLDLGSGNYKYVSAYLRDGALAAYMNPTLDYLVAQEPTTGRVVEAYHGWIAVHRYKRIAGDTRPGVTLVTTNSRVTS